MGLIKHAIDAPFSSAWVTRVGKLILNFGVLELETHLWLVQLSEAPEKIPQFTKLWFSDRVRLIQEFAEKRAYSDDWKSKSLELWNEALNHAKFRNHIAHSPLAFGWNGESEKGEPDFIGVVNLQRRDATQNPLASKDEMDGAINAVVSLATRLAALRSEWCSVRDAKDVP